MYAVPTNQMDVDLWSTLNDELVTLILMKCSKLNSNPNASHSIDLRRFHKILPNKLSKALLNLKYNNIAQLFSKQQVSTVVYNGEKRYSISMKVSCRLEIQINKYVDNDLRYDRDSICELRPDTLLFIRYNNTNLWQCWSFGQFRSIRETTRPS